MGRLWASRSGELTREVTYVGELERLDSRWTLHLQWVDLDNQGHRVALPHEAVHGLLGAAARIMTQAKSDRAMNAAQTRRERAQEFTGPRAVEDDAEARSG